MIYSLILIAVLAAFACAKNIRNFQKQFEYSLPGFTQEQSNYYYNYSITLSYDVFSDDIDKKKVYGGVWFPHAKCLVHIKDDIIFVAYRGSDGSIDDLIADISVGKAYPFESKDYYVHKGFWERSGSDWGFTKNGANYTIASGSIVEFIKNSKSRRVIFTGHSLGAGVAELSYLRYDQINKEFSELKKEIYLLVFGLPICISPKIKEFLGESTKNSLTFDVLLDPIADILNYLFKSIDLFFFLENDYVPFGQYIFIDDANVDYIEYTGDEATILDRFYKKLTIIDPMKHHVCSVYKETIYKIYKREVDASKKVGIAAALVVMGM